MISRYGNDPAFTAEQDRKADIREQHETRVERFSEHHGPPCTQFAAEREATIDAAYKLCAEIREATYRIQQIVSRAAWDRERQQIIEWAKESEHANV